MRILPILLLPVLIGGCVSTATSIVKAPFQVVGKTADLMTTSQEESDRNYGRKMRKAEAREGKERKEWGKKCRKRPDAPECERYDGYVAGRNG